jgi:3-hydroxybutyryl-CoA dehydratase
MSETMLAMKPVETPLVGARMGFRFVVTEAEMAIFAALSGDWSPIHTDDSYAKGWGFDGVLVYGGLMMAKVSRLVGMELPIPHCFENGVKLDFRGPLYVGEEAELAGEITHVSEAVRSVTIKLRIASGDRLVATGAAQMSYRDRP